MKSRFGKGLVAASAAIACLVSNGSFASADEKGSGAHHHGSGHSHQHSSMEIPVGQPVPSINLVAHPDAVNGWNLEVKVTNFKFAPERVNTKSVATEGHAHLLINGEKAGRLYGSWYHLYNLEPGQNTITVTLNANSHESLTYKGKPIGASITVQVPPQRK